MEYNYLDNDYFLVYENAPTPKKLDLPLGSIELPSWVEDVTPQGELIISTEKELQDSGPYRSTPEPVNVEELQQKQETTTPSKPIANSYKDRVLQIMNGLISRIEPEIIKYLKTKPKSNSNNLEVSPREITSRIAAGIVGHLMVESKLNPNNYNGNDLGESSRGLAQWRGNRGIGLINFAKNQKKIWTNLDTQLDYLVSTIDDDLKTKLFNSETPTEASKAWAYYEQFAGYDGTIKTARKLQKQKKWTDEQTKQHIAKEFSNRNGYAEEAYKIWKAGK